MKYLTVTFFLPGQQTSHHEFELKFFGSRIRNNWCMQTIFSFISHSEYNDAEKRYLIFDSTQPFFPPWQDIGNFWILPSIYIHLYELRIWFVRKNLWIGTKPLQIFDGLFIFKLGVDLVHELYQQYSPYSTSRPI